MICLKFLNGSSLIMIPWWNSCFHSLVEVNCLKFKKIKKTSFCWLLPNYCKIINSWNTKFSGHFWNTYAIIYQCFFGLHDCTFNLCIWDAPLNNENSLNLGGVEMSRWIGQAHICFSNKNWSIKRSLN